MAGVSVTNSWDTRFLATARVWLQQQPIDQIFEGNLLLSILLGENSEANKKTFRITRPNRVMRFDGGSEIVIPVAYNKSTNVVSFKHLDSLPLNLDEVATAAKAQWSYYTDAAAVSWQEASENRGGTKMFDLLEQRMKMALATIKERVDTDLYSTGDAVSVGNSGKNIMGLQHLLNVAPTTGTVWNIDRATYSWWQNLYEETAGTFASGGLTHLALFWCNASGTNGEDPPSLYLTTAAQWQAYHTLVQAKQYITTTTVGDLGFPTLEFMGRPIFYGGGLTGAWYQLNMNYMFAALKSGATFDVVPIPAVTGTQLIEPGVRIIFGGQIGFERYDHQAVLTFNG